MAASWSRAPRYYLKGKAPGFGDAESVLRILTSFDHQGELMRVLLVEDESRLLGLIERTLRAEGYDVVATGDGAQGFELARGGQFDLLVLDVMLPSMSGLEITMRLRRLGVRTPILLLTARDAVEDRVAGLDAGADDYLVKPFAFDE